MGSLNVRISQASYKTLRKLAELESDSMQAVLSRAIEAYRRARFLQEANNAYLALRADPKAWAQEQAERHAWDATLADGLEQP